jgi:signal transduction histidine kinase
VNNPLSAIASNTTYLRDELASGTREPPALGEVLGEISQAAERIRLVVRDLNVLGRGDEGAVAEVELAPVIDGAIRLARHEPGAGSSVVVDIVGAAAVLADRGRLARALVNLLVRAGHAQRSRGAVGPVRLRVRPDGREVRIDVAEEGPSAAPDGEAAPQTEAPRESAGGTAYSVAGTLVEAMGGRLEIEVMEGLGSRATLWLPSARANSRS